MALVCLSRRSHDHALSTFDAAAQELAEKVASVTTNLSCRYGEDMNLHVEGPLDAVIKFVRDFYDLTGIGRLVIGIDEKDMPGEELFDVKTLPPGCRIAHV